MTTEATAGPQPTLLDQKLINMSMESSLNIGRSDTRDCPQSEFFNDLVAMKEEVSMDRDTFKNQHRSSTETLRWQNQLSNIPEVKAAGVRELASVSNPRYLKARSHLQLPPFRSLGIDIPHPDYLLTPPDEVDLIKFNLSPQNPSCMSTSTPQSFANTRSSEGTTPETPVVHEFVSASDTNTPRQTQAPVQGAMAGTGSGLDDISSARSTWLEQAVEIATSTIAASNSLPHVLNVLYHSQPCPLSEEATPTTSVFASIITVLQAKLEVTPGRYVEVTHAVPSNFNMARLPTSPIGTPISFGTGEVDYFNMSVFSKAVIAVDHHVASNTSVPSSPHPVVAPSSVGVSLLERFVPPTNLQEYLDLFSRDSPSVLVDRLVELTPDNGSLIFIYPTAHGAATFASRYLGPLLDPILRTMVGIHELTADMGAEVGKMAVVEHMDAFEKTAQKINFLLRHMNRGNPRSGPPPKYFLEHSSKETVQLERQAWTEWWMHQETPRIREVMNRYFQRALRLPQSKEITAGSLVREILNGVENRAYADYDAPREGVEVGVFVIRRTA